MKYALGLAAALIVGSAAISTPVLAQSGASGAQMTGSNATGVQPDSKMSGKMSGGTPMKSKKMKSKKNRM
ncbi:hypothetical protein ASG52_12940 [Methylobacterium sp. Leaf456]|uniref:hypothetical protein n=1 Tax=Methylobacterium sp. Leaf456 TaxID=1736382 RepID=UPI0006F980B2|nr:hypothetical protein [Methylobacterium sp. Leaf456]KQT46618.1 hypothetical protein ASG52_12940 [Methylobacterium sp. Leaf456]